MNYKNLKIAILIADPHDGRGGLENVIIDITQGLYDRGIDSYVAMLEEPMYKEVLSSFPHAETFANRGSLTLGQQKPTFLFRLIWKYKCRRALKFFFKKLKTIQPDAIIVINFPDKFLHHSGLFNSFKKSNPSVPFIAWPHGSLSTLSTKNSNKLKEKIHIFDDFLAISSGIQKELKDVYNIKHSILVHNPIKEGQFVTRDNKKFIYIGRINAPEKRVKLLLKILSQLRGEWHLDLYGTFTSTNAEKEMKDYVALLGIHKNIHFHGWVDNPWNKIKEAGVLLLNSSSEGLPLVLIEAMMRGIPCVSSDCPTGPNEIIHNNINGWLFPVDDEEKCLQIMQEIIDNNRALPSQQQVQDSVKQFSSQKIIDNFSIIIRDIISKKTS